MFYNMNRYDLVLTSITSKQDYYNSLEIGLLVSTYTPVSKIKHLALHSISLTLLYFYLLTFTTTSNLSIYISIYISNIYIKYMYLKYMSNIYISNIYLYISKIYISYMSVFLMYPSLLECKLHESRSVVLLCIAVFITPRMIHSTC